MNTEKEINRITKATGWTKEDVAITLRFSACHRGEARLADIGDARLMLFRTQVAKEDRPDMKALGLL